MPPIYEFKCVKCEQDWDIKRTIPEYEEVAAFECKHCGHENDRDSRVFGKGLSTQVIGVSKGNFGSRDYT